MLFVARRRASSRRALRGAPRRGSPRREATLDNLTTGSRERRDRRHPRPLDKAEADLALARADPRAQREALRPGADAAGKARPGRRRASAQRRGGRWRSSRRSSRSPSCRRATPSRSRRRPTSRRREARCATRRDAGSRRPHDRGARRTGGSSGSTSTPARWRRRARRCCRCCRRDALKVKFYVAEADRPALRAGRRAGGQLRRLRRRARRRRLSYFASDPQFTPPMIYSRDERSRLVFLAEAALDERDGAAARPAGDASARIE